MLVDVEKEMVDGLSDPEPTNNTKLLLGSFNQFVMMIFPLSLRDCTMPSLWTWLMGLMVNTEPE